MACADALALWNEQHIDFEGYTLLLIWCLTFLTDPSVDLVTYVTRYQWDMAKYPIKQSLKNISDIISKVLYFLLAILSLAFFHLSYYGCRVCDHLSKRGQCLRREFHGPNNRDVIVLFIFIFWTMHLHCVINKNKKGQQCLWTGFVYFMLMGLWILHKQDTCSDWYNLFYKYRCHANYKYLLSQK